MLRGHHVLMKRQRGFTLVEMMVAVAIVAILMAVAVPNFQAFIRNTAIRSAAESMQAGLNLARSEALRRNARVTLWVVDSLAATCARSSSGNSWVVSFDNPAGACNAASSQTTAPRLIQSRAGSDGSTGVSVSALTAGATAASCITFNGFGGVESTCTGGGAPIGSIQFTSTGGRRLDIRVTSGGAIRQCDPSADASSTARC
jgi:type IV fimbrial biogenesis protein FimT